MRVIVSCGLAVVLAGCVQTNAAVLNPTVAFSRSCPEAVVVYTTPDRVKSEYVEIALLTSKGDASMTTESAMINSQQKKAAEVGANGLILGGINEPGAGAKVAASILGTSTERKGKALAIWIPADSAKTVEICTAVAKRKR